MTQMSRLILLSTIDIQKTESRASGLLYFVSKTTSKISRCEASIHEDMRRTLEYVECPNDADNEADGDFRCGRLVFEGVAHWYFADYLRPLVGIEPLLVGVKDRKGYCLRAMA